MRKFDTFRAILKGFKVDIEGIASRQRAEIDQATREYNKSVVGEKVQGIKSEYAGTIASVRRNYLMQLDEATAGMRKKNSGKYRENYIDFDLLGKLNVITQSGVQLTSAELEVFTKDAMVSRSSFCVRKVQDMERNNGFELKVPSEAGANLVIDEADRKVREVIEKYDGDPKFTGSTGGHYVSIKMNANGRFLDSLEAKYADETVEDVTITTLSKKEYTKMQQKTAEEAENEGVEVTEVGNLGINAKSTNNGSPAAKYAKAYSERMSTVNPEFE